MVSQSHTHHYTHDKIHISFFPFFTQHLTKGVHYRWGLFAPSGPALDDVSEIVDAGKVLAYIHYTYFTLHCNYIVLRSKFKSLKVTCRSRKRAWPKVCNTGTSEHKISPSFVCVCKSHSMELCIIPVCVYARKRFNKYTSCLSFLFPLFISFHFITPLLIFSLLPLSICPSVSSHSISSFHSFSLPLLFLFCLCCYLIFSVHRSFLYPLPFSLSVCLSSLTSILFSVPCLLLPLPLSVPFLPRSVRWWRRRSPSLRSLRPCRKWNRATPVVKP